VTPVCLASEQAGVILRLPHFYRRKSQKGEIVERNADETS